MKCIKCGRVKAVVAKKDGTYYCNHCGITFEPEDDGTTATTRRRPGSSGRNATWSDGGKGIDD